MGSRDINANERRAVEDERNQQRLPGKMLERIMTQEKPNHHEIPKHYLRGFCEPDKMFLWVFRRDRPFCPGKTRRTYNPFRTGLPSIALRPDGYAARKTDGKTHYEYENALQKIELQATTVINKIRASERISIIEKESLAEYILLMAKRRTSRDVKILPLVEKAKSELIETAQSEMRMAALEGQSAITSEIRDKIDYLESEGNTYFLRESMVKDTGVVQKELTRHLWEFVKAPPGDYFVTSDNPVVNEGLRTYLIFPVSQNVVLSYANNGKDLAYRQATPEEVFKLNAYIISQAEKEIYSPNPDEWIHKRWAERYCIGSSHDTDIVVL